MNPDALLFVVFGHFIGDWALQNPWVAENKGKYWYVLFAHCMIWTGVIATVLYHFDILTLWKVLLLLVGHFILDYTKCLTKSWWCIYPDQLGHIAQCLIVTLF